MANHANYEKTVLRTLWAWADCHHVGELDSRYRDRPVLRKEIASRNILVPSSGLKANEIHAILPSKRHKWFRSLKSSQALAQSVFGAIRAFDRLDLLQNVNAECGRSAFHEDLRGWTLDFEYELRCLGENRRARTSIDVFLLGPANRVAIECKFTEQDFGKCSRTDEKQYREPNLYCNGNFQVQGNRYHRCALTEIDIMYWTYLPHLFDWPADRDHQPCPFGEVYQLARNALAAALTSAGRLDPTNGHVLVIYDARNPEFQNDGKAEKQWYLTSGECRIPGLVRRLSWQSLITAIICAPELAYLIDGLGKKYGLEPD